MSQANAGTDVLPESLGTVPTYITQVTAGTYNTGELANLVAVQVGSELEVNSIYNFTCNFILSPNTLAPSYARLVYSIHDDLADPEILISQNIDYDNPDGDIEVGFSGLFYTGNDPLYYGVQVIAFVQGGGDYRIKTTTGLYDARSTFFSKLTRRI